MNRQQSVRRGRGRRTRTTAGGPGLRIPASPEPLAIAAAAIVSFGIKWLALFLRPHVERRLVLLTPLAGLAIAGLAIAFAEATGKPSSAVLFCGQAALTPLLEHAASYTVGTLVLLIVCKGIAYAISLSSFRGGPTFPGMFIGAVGGIALSHLSGLPMVAGAAIGVGAMTAGMLQLPMTAILLTTLFFGTNGIKVIPLVIVAVVVSFVLSKWLAGPLTAGPRTRRGDHPTASPLTTPRTGNSGQTRPCASPSPAAAGFGSEVRGWPVQCPWVPLHRQGHSKIISNRFAEMIFRIHP